MYMCGHIAKYVVCLLIQIHIIRTIFCLLYDVIKHFAALNTVGFPFPLIDGEIDSFSI